MPHSSSEFHPIRDVGVKLTPPKLRPSIVSVPDRHVGMFAIRRYEIVGGSNVYEVILVPTTAVTVNAGEYGRPAPTAVAQITDEPDVQLIDVQIVARLASCPVGVVFVCAKLTPFKVRLLPEQAGPLIGSWYEITGASNENPLYNVPMRL